MTYGYPLHPSAVWEVSHFIFLNVFFVKNVYLHKKYICTSGLWIYGYGKICMEHLCHFVPCSNAVGIWNRWNFARVMYVAICLPCSFVANQIFWLRWERESGDDWVFCFCFVFSCASVHITFIYSLQIFNSSECRTYLSNVKGNKCNFNVELFQLYPPTPSHAHAHIHTHATPHALMLYLWHMS